MSNKRALLYPRGALPAYQEAGNKPTRPRRVRIVLLAKPPPQGHFLALNGLRQERQLAPPAALLQIRVGEEEDGRKKQEGQVVQCEEEHARGQEDFGKVEGVPNMGIHAGGDQPPFPSSPSVDVLREQPPRQQSHDEAEEREQEARRLQERIPGVEEGEGRGRARPDSRTSRQ